MPAEPEQMATLVTALNGFEFEWKNMWRLADGLNHVRAELTFQLRRPDSQLTELGRFEKASKEEKEDGQTAYPTTAATTWDSAANNRNSVGSTCYYQLAATRAHEDTCTNADFNCSATSDATSQSQEYPIPLTVPSLRRPPLASSPLPLYPTRRTEPILTSSPIAVQPEQITTSPVDLNVAISDTSSSDLPEMDEITNTIESGQIQIQEAHQTLRHRLP